MMNPVIVLDDISVRYRAPEQVIRTFKEYAIQLIRRNVRFKDFMALSHVNLQVKDGEMPLNSYTWIHTDAKLSNEQKNVIINWAGSIRDEMKNKYPIDSLERPKK